MEGSPVFESARVRRNRGASAGRTGQREQSGQSILEFVLLLPLMVAVTFILLRVNTAIQMSIVNQQYSRAQALFLTYNNPVYPSLRFRAAPGNRMTEINVDQMVLGVSDNKATAGYEPLASTQSIVRPGQSIGNDEPGNEQAAERGKIRIRNSVALCTQFNPSSGQIDEATRFSYCRSLYNE